MSGFADDDEDDEPLLSGSGAVQKECTEEELGSWTKQVERCHPTKPSGKMSPFDQSKASWARQKGYKSRFHNFHPLNPQ